MRASLRVSTNALGLSLYFLSLLSEVLGLALLPLALRIIALEFLDFIIFLVFEILSSIRILFMLLSFLNPVIALISYSIGILAYSIFLKILSILLYRNLVLYRIRVAYSLTTR